MCAGRRHPPIKLNEVDVLSCANCGYIFCEESLSSDICPFCASMSPFSGAQPMLQDEIFGSFDCQGKAEAFDLPADSLLGASARGTSTYRIGSRKFNISESTKEDGENRIEEALDRRNNLLDNAQLESGLEDDDVGEGEGDLGRSLFPGLWSADVTVEGGDEPVAAI